MTGSLTLLGTPPLIVPAGATAGYVATSDASGNVAWARGNSTVTVTVGFSGADFICTGTHDGPVIQAAMNSLPSGGGKILIRNSAVPYGFSAASDCMTLAKSNVTIEGETYGGVTLKASAAIFTAGHAQYGILTVGRTQSALLSNVTLRNLIFDCGNQFNTAGLTLDGGSAMAGQTGLQNVLAENVTVRNQCQNLPGAPGGEHASGMTIQSGKNNSVGNRGYVDRVTYRRCELGSSQQDGMWCQGTNITNILWTECYIHDCQGNGVLAFDYNNGGITNANWTVDRCRFEHNMITPPALSTAHFRDQTQVGVINFTFSNNYVGPTVDPTRIGSPSQDFVVTPYDAPNTRITGNLFDNCGAVISLGRSLTGAEYRNLPLSRVYIADNVFQGCRTCFDADSAAFMYLRGNIFSGILYGPVFGPYSDHWPTIIEDNIFYDCNVNDPNAQGTSNRAFLRVGGNGITVRGNSFIDDRLLTDPSASVNGMTLTQVAGGSLGSRTYFVNYTFANATGETKPGLEQSLAVSAGNLLVVTVTATAQQLYGATELNVYVGTSTGTETFQASLPFPALTAAWTEPAAGAATTGAGLPVANTTQAQTNYGIYELGGNGAAGNYSAVYADNQFYGIPPGNEIVTNSNNTRVLLGNLTNPTMANGATSVMAGTVSTVAKRVVLLAVSGSTYTPAGDTTDIARIDSPAAAFTVANPTGTPSDGQTLIIRIRSGATPFVPTWGSAYEGSAAIPLPSSCTASAVDYLGFQWNPTSAAWLLLAYAPGYA